MVDLEDGSDDDNDEIGTEESPFTSNVSSYDYLDQQKSGHSHSDSSSGGYLSMDESIGNGEMRAKLASLESRAHLIRSADESTYQHFATNSLRGSSMMLQTAAGTCLQGASQALINKK